MKLNFSVKFKSILIPLLFLILFIGIILIIKAPIKQIFEYNLDEGFNITKSSLFLNGFSLYKEIWSDQPPLFTLILSYWFKLFGLSVCHARILVLLFSGILLWAFYQTIKNLWGSFSGLVAIIFLLLSALYLRLSMSVMIGIPSLSLAMLSILCITLYRKSHLRHLLVLSGIFMALSLQTKFFTAFLIPLIVSEIVQAKNLKLRGKKQRNRLLSPLLLWSGNLLTVYLAIIIIFFHFNFPLMIQQLFQPHLKKITVPGCDFSTIWRMILTDYDIALLALMGIISLIRQKKWQSLFPALWLVIALIILLKHRPIWKHYYLLLSIPISWLAAITFSQFFIRNKEILKTNKFIFFLTAGIITLSILRTPHKFQRTYESIRPQTELQNWEIVNLLLEYRPHIHWIFTDRPIFAFYANMLVPPELAIITEKRDFTENITQDYCINKLQEYRPELILLNDLKYYGPKVISYIKKNYSEIYQTRPYQTETTENVKIFMRKDISKNNENQREY